MKHDHLFKRLEIRKELLPFFLHSYLKESTGLSFEALYAGTTPDITPIITARVSVHVHKPPAVTFNETPEELHIFTGLCQKI
ncbi:MAG TPA: hypothetical protein VGK06_13905 [Methanosarcina sp.]|jgi:hypothetical protein